MFSDPKLPPIPDFILEKMGGAEYVKMAHHIGFQGPERWTRKPNKSAYISDPGTKTPSQTFIPTDLKSKIVDGDYAALTQARNQNLNDLQPNMTTIQNASSYSDAFVTVTNESNNQDYLMCASDAGWIWTYTTQISYSSNDSSKSNTGDNTTTQCVIQSGTYSKNGNILGLSYQTLESVPTQITALAASVIVASIVFNYVKGYIADTVFETALSAALAAAAEEAVVGGFMANAAAASIVATIGAGLAAGVIGAVIAVVIFYLADVLHRSYGLTLTVFNWDPKFAWDVISWYGDNAVVSQESAADGPWRAASLRPVQNSVPGPFGPVASKNNPVAQYASYAYANKNEWLEGLGVAMLVTSGNATFYLGYVVQRWGNNLIALSSNASQSIATWYNTSGTWRPSGDYAYTGTIDGRPDITVTIITTSLNGDRAYNCEVHIGIQQSHSS